MEQEVNSWLRRTKFSHTVYHGMDSAKLVSVLSLEPDHYCASARAASSSSRALKSSASFTAQLPRNHAPQKQRSVSPLPQTAISDVFKEARSSKKRFSTPAPQRRDSKIEITKKKPSKEDLTKSESRTSPLRQFTSMKVYDKLKSKKASGSWKKYFDHSGGRVTSVDAIDETMVDLSQLYFGPKFAHGANSQLYQGIYKDNPVAVKIIRMPDNDMDDDENGTLIARLETQFNREVMFLSRLHHENVIKLVAAWRNAPVFSIITEYLSEGSLRAYLYKLEHDHNILPLEKLVGIALDIASGMEFIHSKGVVHRDLKPENILINEDFRMKIADFGIACEESSCDLFTDDPGTYRWMAPEMIKRKPYNRKVDVYSFGLLLWEMVAGTIPYSDMTPIQAAFAVVNKNLRPVIPGNCPDAMRALIEQCWCSHPEKRPDFWQIMVVLRQFESSLIFDGTLKLVEKNPLCHDHKKGLRHWIQKLAPVHSNMPKPRFA